ncbi:MAG: SURF1 family protein [Alphaproteobacteria bacterium]
MTFAFKPRLIPTLIALPLFLTLLGLGVWQLERREWKTALLADIEARLAMPPAALVDLLPLGPAANYRPVYVVGVYRHDREMLVQARTHEGQIGVQVVTPFQLIEERSAEDAGSGVKVRAEAVLVNRGWVPLEMRDPKTRADSQPAGEMVVTGLLRWPAAPGWFTPKNDPARNQWYWMEVPAMAETSNLRDLVPAYIELGRNAAAPDALPIGGQTIVRLPNNHLQYALTWFALAAALLATYILSQRRRSGG